MTEEDMRQILTKKIQDRVWERSQRLMDQVKRGDILGAIIRGHVYIERHLYESLESAVLDTKALKDARLNYGQIVCMCLALGLLSDDDAPALFSLNSLRNKFAHNIDTELTDKHLEDFRNTLSAGVRKFIPDSYDKYSNERKLRQLMTLIYIHLETEASIRKLNQDIAEVLKEIRATPDSSTGL